MKEYLDIVKHVLDHGKWKKNRTGIPCLTSLPTQIFQHNMVRGFPLLTTKKVSLKTIAVELNGVVQGVTDKKWYQERGCNIWNEWSNPASEDNDDLGAFYAHQLRRFGQSHTKENGLKYGIDQLNTILHMLNNDPNDRRMVVSYWNPLQLDVAALPPCHFAWCINHVNGILNLTWTQRSTDLFLGAPYNIASYALLLLLLCREGNFKPGFLTGVFCDSHFYANCIQQAKEQLGRKPYPLPHVKITNDTGILNWTYKDIELTRYEHHPPIKADVAI